MNDCVTSLNEVSEISSMINLAEDVHKRLVETIAVMQVTADRVLGSQPESDEQFGELRRAPNGLIDSFRITLEVFAADVGRAKELADRLAKL